jgi:hypothetical protein
MRMPNPTRTRRRGVGGLEAPTQVLRLLGTVSIRFVREHGLFRASRGGMMVVVRSDPKNTFTPEKARST